MTDSPPAPAHGEDARDVHARPTSRLDGMAAPSADGPGRTALASPLSSEVGLLDAADAAQPADTATATADIQAPHDAAEWPLRRRSFMLGTATAGASGLALVGTPGLAAAPQEAYVASPAVPVPVQFRVNGRPQQLSLEARASLLDVLREQLHLTGAKKGCDHGQCGACTVHMDGERVASCLTLAVKADGCDVTTIEGIGGHGGGLHPMQQAFIDHDALQCGYCTPGQVMAAIACVREGHATTDDEIREYMSGNICRCGAYVAILAAVRDAARRMEGGPRA